MSRSSRGSSMCSTLPSRLLLSLLAAITTGCDSVTDPQDALAPRTSVAAKSAPATPTPVVVMSGLDNPRGVAMASDGTIYVAESGNTTLNGVCIATPPRGDTCWSGTGAISRLRRGVQERIATHMPSTFLRIRQRDPVTGVDRFLSLDATGPHHLVVGESDAGMLTMGLGIDPALRPALGPDAAALGHLIRFLPNGKWNVAEDIAAFEAANNPDTRGLNSNAYGLAMVRGRALVADAGANDVIEVAPNGAMSLVAVFPRIPKPAGLPGPALVEAVPTAVRVGVDGALYVSHLTGVPFAAGLSAIYRLADDGTATMVAGGFKSIIDFDIAGDGTIYVLQHASSPFNMEGPGRLIAVSPDGTRTTRLDNLVYPTAVLVGRDDDLYVTNVGTTSGQGQLLRLSR